VAVRPDLRGKGLGMLATAAAVGEARSRGAPRVFLLTETAEGFFEALGFSVIERDTLPETIRTNARTVEECPSAVAMAIDLHP
jgi:N-acetylglutamate synthase-like GNAT family acetyltransferase